MVVEAVQYSECASQAAFSLVPSHSPSTTSHHFHFYLYLSYEVVFGFKRGFGNESREPFKSIPDDAPLPSPYVDINENIVRFSWHLKLPHVAQVGIYFM